ncbi:MAG: hypothetical protein HOP33_10640, partial [Verrucomicrobia bacterium]|nr:hypothetical protein [Verrucomicrobiota bacterium]
MKPLPRSLILAGRICLVALVATVANAQVVYLDHQHMDFRLQYNPAAEGTNRLDIILGYDTGV